MTKLTEWITVGISLVAIWLAILYDFLPISGAGGNESIRFWIYLAPIIAVGVFGLVSVGIIAYRVATFNDCKEAAEELKQEIEEAKKDLKSKGFKFE